MLDMTTSEQKNNALARRERAWLEARIHHGEAQGEYSEIVTITPGIAAALLERNQANRKLKQARIGEMIADIQAGRWQLNGETIKISSDGFLNDGQNRLTAVVESGLPIRTFMAFGVARETQSSVDIGTPRTVADMVGMRGDRYGNACASAARLLLMYESGLYSSAGTSTPSKLAVNDFYSAHRDEIAEAVAKLSCAWTNHVGLGAFAAAYVVLDEVNPAYTPVFFRKLIDESELKRTDPRFVVHAYLSKMKLRPHEKLDVILRHWNAWREGRPIYQAISPQGMYPKKITK